MQAATKLHNRLDHMRVVVANRIRPSSDNIDSITLDTTAAIPAAISRMAARLHMVLLLVTDFHSNSPATGHRAALVHTRVLLLVHLLVSKS